MNVLILNGSPRRKGNTSQMIQAFCEGLEASGHEYHAAMFSYQGDFLDYLGLEGLGVFTTNGYDPGVPEEKLDEIRQFGMGL